MANIVEKIRQIRQAVYGKDVRESIASSLEEMNKDNVEAVQSANTAVSSANIAIESANAAKENADIAAENANNAKRNADVATQGANDAARSANDIANELNRKLAAGELKGDPGSSILYGQGIPLDENGNFGDWYYDTASERWDVYYKSSTGWEKMGWIKGELGGDTVPIGATLPCTTNVIPDGWLLCDGSLISRTEYSELFAVIGESYGAGDGETTFALPNEPNPLSYTKENESIQFAEHEPALYMIIKAKQVIPVTGGIINDPDCNSETDALSAAATKNVIEQTTSQSASSLLAKIPNPNMLINGDFQVWQRGTEFDGVSGYTADRCMSYASQSAAIAVSKADNGLQFTSKKAAIMVPYSYRMEPSDLKKVRGKTVTLSYSIDGIMHSFTLNDFGQVYIQDDAILESHTLPSTDSTLGNLVIVIQYTVMTIGESHTLNWVKLELGETATPFVPRPYVEELMICKRYFNVVNMQSRFTLVNTNGDTFGMNTNNSVPMYRLPDVKGLTYPFTLSFRCDGKGIAANITSASAKWYGDNILVEFKGDKTAVVNTAGYLINNYNIQLDAEIYD